MEILRSWYRNSRGKITVLFEDETDLLLFPPLRSAWARRGKPNRVWISGQNAKRVVFGAINLETGHHIELERPKRRAEDFCTFLLELHRRYRRSGHLALILDRDPGHSAKKSQQLASELGIELHWLPVRSPELNPMESLWGFAKPRVCANRQYKTIQNEVKTFVRFLRRLSPSEALRIAGLRSDRFWMFS